MINPEFFSDEEPKEAANIRFLLCYYGVLVDIYSESFFRKLANQVKNGEIGFDQQNKETPLQKSSVGLNIYCVHEGVKYQLEPIPRLHGFDQDVTSISGIMLQSEKVQEASERCLLEHFPHIQTVLGPDWVKSIRFLNQRQISWVSISNGLKWRETKQIADIFLPEGGFESQGYQLENQHFLWQRIVV